MNLLLLHHPKAKTIKQNQPSKSFDKSYNAFRSSSFVSQATYQLLPKTLLAGLIDPVAANCCSPSSSDFKAAPSVAVTSLHSLSSSSSNSLLLAATGELKSFVPGLEANLTMLSNTISIISDPDDAFRLLNYYYSDLNKLPLTSEMFPYLHGLNGYKQRIFFDEILNSDYKTNQELANTLNLDDFNLQEFNGPILIPQLSNHFHLMFISLTNISPCDDIEYLQNTINFEDLMTHGEDGFSYKPFSYINEFDSSTESELNNRNFKAQVKLAANFSNFLVYNPSNDMESNRLAANFISEALGDNPLNQKIFILNIPDMSTTLEQFLDINSEYQKVDNYSDETFDCRLLQWEQSLIWKVNSSKWIHPNVCIGSLLDFNRLHENSEDHCFKMFVNCHQTSSLPDMKDLENILINSLAYNNDPDLMEPIYLEFPSSGNFNLSTITFDELLSFLNLLFITYRLIKEKNQKVFILCYDGFTGLSLLSLSLAYLLRLDEKDLTDCSTEELCIDLLADPLKDLRLYFFRSDFLFMKHLEKSLCWMYFTILKPRQDSTSKLSIEQDTTLILDLDYKAFTKFSKFLKASNSLKANDWFDINQDNNFPSRIVSNLYLGSLNHALSLTILNAHKISRIVSVGEKPLWFESLNKHVVLECDLEQEKEGKRKIIKPVYTHGFVQFYIINVNSSGYLQIPNLPNLEHIVYIHNLKDDGKDSILPLLTEIPDSVRNEILVDPKTSRDATLIHCRIGVSRSATLVIATLMKFFNWSLLESYMFVRVKRFNIIIQPNLKIFYELFLYEEYLRNTMEKGGTRTLCWEALCNEVHKLNHHYIGGDR